jgi:hypothetical protein
MGEIIDGHIQDTEAAGKGKRAVSAADNNNTWNGQSLIPVLFHILIAKIDK